MELGAFCGSLLVDVLPLLLLFFVAAAAIAAAAATSASVAKWRRLGCFTPAALRGLVNFVGDLFLGTLGGGSVVEVVAEIELPSAAECRTCLKRDALKQPGTL